MKTVRTVLASAVVLALSAGLMATPVGAHAKRKPLKHAVVAPAAPAATPSETPEAARARLNAEQAAAAKKQNDDNAAAKAAYDQSVLDRENLIAKQKADYDAAMRKWEADTAACKAGDLTRCAAPK